VTPLGELKKRKRRERAGEKMTISPDTLPLRVGKENVFERGGKKEDLARVASEFVLQRKKGK